MERPLISFIIAYYNLPTSMLNDCIASILALSLQPCEREIIVVDDGSDQSPLNDLKSYTSDILYIRQSHQGLSEARNAGIQMATGSYLQFVDADDRLLCEPYNYCLSIVRTKQPEMVLFHHIGKVSNSKINYTVRASQSGSHYMRHHNFHGSACGYLFSRAILGDLRFTSDIRHEDEEFTPLLLLRADSVISTNAKAYQYKKRENSIMSATNIRHLLKRLNDNKSIISRLNEMADTLPTESRIALQRRVHQLTMDYLYNIILLTRNRHYLDRRIAELHAIGLYPLPKRDYTRKYIWFRRLINTEIGISMLMRAIPLMKKER
jgi:glycosyltransferase involved in cell wall biosynthesis